MFPSQLNSIAQYIHQIKIREKSVIELLIIINAVTEENHGKCNLIFFPYNNIVLLCCDSLVYKKVERVICLNIQKYFKVPDCFLIMFQILLVRRSEKVAPFNSVTELLFISVDSILNCVFLSAENSGCENLPIGDLNYGESEKKNDNGIESFKSSPKIHRSSMVVLKTEEEMKYRRKYFNGKAEAGNYANSKPEYCVMVRHCVHADFVNILRSSSFIYIQVPNINVSLPTPIRQNDSSQGKGKCKDQNYFR
jgi:hypothetical protein